MSSEEIYAFWCRYPSARNFGDALTPWIIHKITGRYPVFARPEERQSVYLAVGSVIGYSTAASRVWGSGILSRTDLIDPAVSIYAVRGPITRARAIACGAQCPEIYGDPALLLPMFYSPARRDRDVGVGVIPHYFEKPRVFAHWRVSEGCSLIDIQQPVERVIDEIVRCHFVLSSSLHGLIAAHAYGIPAMWVVFSTSLLGDGSKFHDYLASIGQPLYEPARVDMGSFRPYDFVHRIPELRSSLEVQPLWETCPFRAPQAH